MAAPVEGPENAGTVAVRPPVRVAGVNKSTPLSLTDGQLADLLLGSRQALVVQLAAIGTTVSPTPNSAGDGSNGATIYNMFPFVFNGATYDRPRTPITFKPFASTPITAGVGATIWTPAGGKKFRLMGWLISTSAAGQLIFGDNAVGTVIARSEAAAAAGVSKAGAADLGNGLLSAAANNVLKLDGPTGNVAGMVWGCEE